MNPAPPQASALVLASFVILPLLVAFLMGHLYTRAHRRVGSGPSPFRVWLGILIWLAVSALAALSGGLARLDLRPPPFLLFAAVIILGACAFGLSRAGAVMATLPWSLLVGLNAFRFPLELAMHRAAVEGVMPEQMSYTGRNFDVLTGVSALVLGLALARAPLPRWIVAAWNLFGSVALLNIVTIAILSTPMVHAFGTEPANLNTFVTFFPFVWLPAILVAAAMALHIIVARALLRDRSARAGGA